MPKYGVEVIFLSLFRKSGNSDQPEAKKDNWKQSLILDLRDVLVVLVLFLTVYMMLFRIVVVVGPSMYDTLIHGDRVLILSSTVYRDPKPGDIIIASLQDYDNGECIVKRIIATEGQKVDIDFEEGIVYVDDVALDEHLYVTTPTNMSEGVEFPLVVDPGCLFVMGDNRNSSKDSRSHEIGLVDTREVVGKVLFLVVPGDNYGYEERDWSRFGVIK